MAGRSLWEACPFLRRKNKRKKKEEKGGGGEEGLEIKEGQRGNCD